MNTNWSVVVTALAVVPMLWGCSTSSPATSTVTVPSAFTARPATSGLGGGITQLSGPEVAARAASALRDAGSAHITGIGTFMAAHGARLDFVLTTDSGTATVITPTTHMQMIKVGAKSYMEAPGTFWAEIGMPPNMRPKLAGRWVAMPASAKDKLLSVTGFANELAYPSTGGPYLDKTSTSTYHGVRVVVLTQKDGSTLYVAASGPPLPLFLHGPSTRGTEGMTFGEYGKRVTIAAPQGAVDIATALKGAKSSSTA